MQPYRERIAQARAALDDSAFLLIGGGSGLSAAAGLTYSGPRFTENFSDFIEKYGVEDMYSASFYPFKTEEELWAHWARHISVNRYKPEATALYRQLLAIAERKPYFVITTNVESQFEKALFDRERIFEVQGNYAFLQCASACHDGLYYNEEQVRQWLRETRDCRIPTDLVPRCPVCGKEMDVHLRHNDHFVQDASWYAARARYTDFLGSIQGKRVVCLELGVGFNTPGIIRYPFEQLVHRNKGATLIRLNRDDSRGPAENSRKTVSFDENMIDVLQQMVGDQGQIPARSDYGTP